MKRIIVILIILLTLTGSWAYYRYKILNSQQLSKEIVTVPVQQGEFMLTIQDTGVIKAKNSSLVVVPGEDRRHGNYKIAKLIPEGAKVQKGDPVCWFDMTDLERQFKEVEYRVKRNEADIKRNEEAQRLQRENRSRIMKQRKLDWDSAKLELELETEKYEKYKRLVSEEILPLVQLEDEERKYRMSVLRADQAEKEYLKAAEQEASDEKLKEIELERIRSQSQWYQDEYDDIKKQLEQSILYASDYGIVIYAKNWRNRTMQPIKEGDTLHSGNQVAFIPDLSEIQVMTQVNETDVSKVKLDMPVSIKMDSIPDLILSGKVTNIGNLAMERERSQGSGQVSTEESSGIKVFEITVDLASTDDRLRPGMTCKVDIIMDKIPSAVYFPLKALHIERGAKYVLILNNGKIEKRIVTLGRENGKDVIVEKGLKPDERLILPEEET